MAKQTFTTGQVLTAAQMTSLQQTAMGGGSATAKTTSYVLVAADAGTTVAMNAAGATTITVNTSLFAAGDTVFIQNLGAGACTVTAGTATVSTAGDLILPQYDAGILYFTATGAAIFYDYVQRAASAALVGCQAYVTSGSQTAVDSTDTIVNLGSELFDTDGFHSTSSNTSRFTIPSGKAGKYNLTTTIYVGSAISYRAISVLVNGSLLTAYGLSGGQFNVYNDNGTIASGSVVLSLSVADYVQVAIQVYGGNRTISSANVSLIYLGA